MKLITIENEFIRLSFLQEGATIVEFIDKRDEENLVLRYQDLERYKDNPYYLGVTVGRNAGRIFPASYTNQNDEVIVLDQNEGQAQLHGGEEHFHFKKWKVESLKKDEAVLSLIDSSKYFSRAEFTLTYKLEGRELLLKIEGKSDFPTIMNLTNHSYFRMTPNVPTIQGDSLQIQSHLVQAIDKETIPTGTVLDVNEKQYAYLDFQEPKKIRESLYKEDSISKFCLGGLDLAYLFEREMNSRLKLVSSNGQKGLEVTSNQESVVVYTLNKLLPNEKEFLKFAGITFEFQKRPNYIHDKNYSGEVLQKDFDYWVRYRLI